MRCLILLILLCCVLSCSKESSEGSGADVEDSSRIVLNSFDAEIESDIPVIQPDPPPPPPEPQLTREERCAQTPIQETQAYCACFPDCCDRQRWYCPPNPRQTIDVMQVILEVCDENKQRCEFGVDPECPPPEIISQSECITQWECPPGTSGEFIRWFEC